MTKRIISIILAAVMLFSFPAFAEDTTVEVKPDSGNMLFAKSMGIVNADAVGTDVVTRLALAKMFCSVMRTDVGLAPNTGIVFTDVPEEASTVVAHVANMGIMNGVGGGVFAPDAPVTYIQAIKAMVTFLGYSQNAEAKNGYPFGYYMQAMELGLTSGAPKDINTELTFEKAVTLFKLALNVDYREPVEFNPEVKYEISKNLTYLHYHRDIVRVRGVVKSTSVSDISGVGKTPYNKIRINSNLLNFEPVKVNAQDYFGHIVDAYVELDTEKILFIEDVGTTVTEIESNQISGLVGDNIEYYNSADKKKKLPINNSTRILYNGTNLSSYTESDINPFAVSTKDGRITAIENTGDDIYDIICVDAYDTYVVDRVVGNKIYAKNTVGAIFDLEKEAEYKEGETFLLYNILGEPIKVSDIKEGNTVSVSEDKNGNVTRIVVTIDKLIGIIGAVETRGGKMYITVNGASFECSNLVTSIGAGEITIGKKARLSFNKDGMISDIDQEPYSTWNVGYLTGYGVTTNHIDPETQVKIFGEDARWYIYNLADKIIVTDRNNKDVTNTKDKSDFITEAGTGGDGLVVRQPILYRLDSNKELKEVIFANTSADVTAPITQYDALKESSPFYAIIAPKSWNSTMQSNSVYGSAGYTVANGVESVYFRHQDGGFDIAHIDPTAVYFNVPSNDQRNEESKYSVMAVSSIKDDATKKFELYCTDEYPMIDVMVVKDTVASSIHADTGSITIKSIKKVVDADGNTVTQVEANINNSATSVVYTDPDNVIEAAYDALTGAAAGTKPEAGDILRITANGYKEIVLAEPGFDASAKRMLHLDTATAEPGDNINSTSLIYSPRYTFGTVDHIESSFMTVKATMHDGSTKTELYPLSGHAVTKVTKDARGNITVEKASVKDIVSAEYGEGSTVLVHLKATRRFGIIIYEGF